MQKRLLAQVYGRVQGVSFRWFVKRKAEKLSLTGWVKNERDGSVTVVAEGEEEDLRQFERAFSKGPFFAEVSHVQARYTGATREFNSFEIRF